MIERDGPKLPIARTFDFSEACTWQISEDTGLSLDYLNDFGFNLFAQAVSNMKSYFDSDALADLRKFQCNIEIDPVVEARSQGLRLLNRLSEEPIIGYSEHIRRKVDLVRSMRDGSNWKRFSVGDFLCSQTQQAADRLDELASTIASTVRPVPEVDVDLTRLLSSMREAVVLIKGGKTVGEFDSFYNLNELRELFTKAGLQVC